MSRVKAIEQGNYREYTPLLHLSTGRFLSTRFRGDYTSSRHVFKPIAADRANARACTGCQLRDPRTHGTVGGEASSAYETYAASDLQDLGYCRVLSSWNSFLDMHSLLQAEGHLSLQAMSCP